MDRGLLIMLKRISGIGHRNVDLVGLQLAQVVAGFCKVEKKNPLAPIIREEFID